MSDDSSAKDPQTIDLRNALSQDDQEKINQLVLSGENINHQNNIGWTLLQHACLKGRTAMVRELIRLGANVNLADDFGWSPLHEACFSGNLMIVKMLLAAGANSDQAMDKEYPRTPIDIAQEEGHDNIVAFLKDCKKKHI